ncbi:MAG: ABC transporter ATP-binding protein, partial [Fibrobacter sp.]|nr:ABC transporter ATP-binding protein [Fibrobacter sp.]
MGRVGRAYLTEEELANRPKVSKALLLRISSYLKPYWKQMILVLVAIVFSTVLRIFPAILTGKIIDEGLIGRDLNTLIWLLAISFLVMLLANLIGVLESYLNTWIAQHITFDMRNGMFRHLQSMSHRFFTTNNQGDIITRMT